MIGVWNTQGQQIGTLDLSVGFLDGSEVLIPAAGDRGFSALALPVRRFVLFGKLVRGLQACPEAIAQLKRRSDFKLLAPETGDEMRAINDAHLNNTVVRVDGRRALIEEYSQVIHPFHAETTITVRFVDPPYARHTVAPWQVEI